MEAIKNDIIKVISKYMEIDSDGLDIPVSYTHLLTEGVSWLSWLGYGQTFGFSSPLVLDLGVLAITFALTIKITIASIIGVVIAILIYRLL